MPVYRIILTYLQWSKLHPPANWRVGRRWLESHALPVSGLDVLSNGYNDNIITVALIILPGKHMYIRQEVECHSHNKIHYPFSNTFKLSTRSHDLCIDHMTYTSKSHDTDHVIFIL